jgi:hypothetical protein
MRRAHRQPEPLVLPKGKERVHVERDAGAREVAVGHLAAELEPGIRAVAELRHDRPAPSGDHLLGL